MNSTPALTWEQAKQVAVQAIFNSAGKHLKDVEIIVLRGAWAGQSDEKIGELRFLSVNYLRGDVEPELWQKRSEALGKEVTKTNFKGVLEQASPVYPSTKIPASPSPLRLLFPEGSVALDSPFYVEREGVESLCYSAIAKPSALIRIEAPKLMGKSSLITRVVTQGQSLAQLHGLDWGKAQVAELMKMVGGHPYLVRLALYEVGSGRLTLGQLLQQAATEAGIYSNHLRRHLKTLQQSLNLAQAFYGIL